MFYKSSFDCSIRVDEKDDDSQRTMHGGLISMTDPWLDPEARDRMLNWTCFLFSVHFLAMLSCFVVFRVQGHTTLFVLIVFSIITLMVSPSRSLLHFPCF